MKRHYKIALALLVAAPALLFFAAGRHTTPAVAQVPQMHLDLDATSNAIPPTCTSWQELYPAYDAPHHQTGYEDNGDGVISPCDYIFLEGARWHIVWVGPTYFMSCGADQAVYEPTIDQGGGSPVCETWHQIHPVFCEPTHIDTWMDNGDGVLGVCDVLQLTAIGWWHIDRIGLDIIVEPGPTATDEASWGKVKQIFRDMF